MPAEKDFQTRAALLARRAQSGRLRPSAERLLERLTARIDLWRAANGRPSLAEEHDAQRTRKLGLLFRAIPKRGGER